MASTSAAAGSSSSAASAAAGTRALLQAALPPLLGVLAALPADKASLTAADEAQALLAPRVRELAAQLGPRDGDVGEVVRDATHLALRDAVLDALPVHASGAARDDDGMPEVGLDDAAARALFDRLDVVVAFDEAALIDAAQPLLLLEELFDALPLPACAVLFAYLRSRLHLLTVALSPARSKGLTLLRTCNELLRRLSKPTRADTVLAGRVLSLLSAVFPLGERSGVNLRGDFNVENRTALQPLPEAASPKSEDAAMASPDAEGAKASPEAKETASSGSTLPALNTPGGLSAVCASPAFYATFWSLQSFFSNPALLFADSDASTPEGKDPAPDGASGAMKNLRVATRLTLDVFIAAAKQERLLAGAAASDSAAARLAAAAAAKEREKDKAGEERRPTAGGQLKLQEQQEDADVAGERQDEDFFPKYLTGRNLLEYELRDPLFRRHVLVQWLILFQYLLSLAKAPREKWATWKNKALIVANFTLTEADDLWIRATWREIVKELKTIPPEGKVFSDSVLLTLRREARWINWKTENCPPIDRPSLSVAHILSTAQASFRALRAPKRFPHALGTAALSSLWEEGLAPPVPRTRKREDEEGNEIEVLEDGLDDLEMPPRVPDLQYYAKQIRMQEDQANKRRKALEQPTIPTPTTAARTADELRADVERAAKERDDAQLAAIEAKRQSLSWRALRLAAKEHLNLLTPAIGTDDVTRLMLAIEEERNPKPKPPPAPAAAPAATTPTTSSPSSSQPAAAKPRLAALKDEAQAGVSAAPSPIHVEVPDVPRSSSPSRAPEEAEKQQKAASQEDETMSAPAAAAGEAAANEQPVKQTQPEAPQEAANDNEGTETEAQAAPVAEAPAAPVAEEASEAPPQEKDEEMQDA